MSGRIRLSREGECGGCARSRLGKWGDEYGSGSTVCPGVERGPHVAIANCKADT